MLSQSITQPIAIHHSLTRKDAQRYLKRLSEKGAFLALASDMENAVIMRMTGDGHPVKSAVVGRSEAQGMALSDWISPKSTGRVSKYEITSAGRMALKRMLAEAEETPKGLDEAPCIFGEQHREWGDRDEISETTGKVTRRRVNLAESPLTLLSRRKGVDGKPFLSADLITAGERLREDFEISQLGPSITQNWDTFLTGPRAKGSVSSGIGNGASAAAERFRAAIDALGPGLSDVALRCCCFQEGMEATEKHMGWSARSGKIVLRIALQRLRLHYENTHGKHGPMIE